MDARYGGANGYTATSNAQPEILSNFNTASDQRRYIVGYAHSEV
jgi:hypothetical protein